MADNRTDIHCAMMAAFVQGAAWWEQKKTGATMWQSDRNDAEAEAFAKMCNGTLGAVKTIANNEPNQSRKKALE